MTVAAVLGEELLLRARACGLCAVLLSEKTNGEEARAAAAELGPLLARLDDGEALAAFNAFRSSGDPECRDYIKPLVRGTVSPYETSYEAPPGSPGEKPLRLADIAGFYRAFGFQAAGERSDHVAVEIEFVALLCAKEGYARISGEDAGAEVCAESRRAFVNDHFGAWLPAFARCAAEQDAEPRLTALLELATQLVTAG